MIVDRLNPYVFVPKRTGFEDVLVDEEKLMEERRDRSHASAKARDPRISGGDGWQAAYRKEPDKFARNVLGVHLWSKQREVLGALAGYKRTSVRSCNGAGKTFTAAVAVLWWMASYENAICITTAPSEKQVRDLLWREVRRLYHRVGRRTLGGRLTRTRLEYSPTRFAYGFSTNTEERFQGYHSGNILVIVDEASGVHERIFDAIQGLITVKNSKLLMIGNPHGYAGTFYDSFHKNGARHKTIHISAFDLPSFKEAGLTAENIGDAAYDIVDDNLAGDDDAEYEDVEVLNPLGLSVPDWAIDVYHNYGPQSSVYQTRVLGQFPDQADDTLIGLRFVEAAVRRDIRPASGLSVIMGVDIARMGDDATVFCVRQGGQVLDLEPMRKSDLVDVTGRIVNLCRAWNVDRVVVDMIGIGSGVHDNLKRVHGLNVVGFNSNFAPVDKDSYRNLRAEAFDGLRARFEEGNISIPQDPELVSQVASLTYKYDVQGRLQLESKDVIRNRGQQSPDKADALAIAYSQLAEHGSGQAVRSMTKDSFEIVKRMKRENPRLRY